jgi:ASC-1-like (ASCH) protein
MDHVAIMNKKWKLIDKILSGDKTIESRWYKNKIAPWDKIKEGDVVYFKDTGEPITAKAKVSKVLQFKELDTQKIKELISTYGKDIGLGSWSSTAWYNNKNYCILIFLKDPEKVYSFNINKKGFGNAAAWLCVNNISRVLVPKVGDKIG